MLPNSGNCSYNGIAFTSLYRSKVEVKPVKDSAGRALVGREYTIEIEGRIVATLGSTTDVTLADMRVALEKPAGALIYTEKGFGPLQVNVAGGQVWDAAYGPWPEVLAWDPVGNDQGCVVRWKCSTLVPCEENPKTRGILEYCWSVSWDIDQNGYSTRRIEGHLTIQATRNAVNDRTLPDNADAYRDQVVPDLPLGFKREQSFKLSEDKRTLEFTFEDEEQAQQALPAGVSEGQVRHKVSWRRGGGGTPPLGSQTISGTLTVPARTPKAFVFEKILMLLRAKWPLGQVAVGTDRKTGLFYFLDHIDIDDDLFGPSTAFSATARLLGAVFPSQVLSNSGLWAPLPGSNYLVWKQSIFTPSGGNLPMSPRGAAGMSFLNQDDVIVDLCASQARLLKANGQTPGQGRSLKTGLPRQLNGQIIPPQNTWLQYRLRVRLLENDRVARHKPLTGTSQLKTVKPLDGFLTTDYQNSPGLKTPQPNEIGGSLSSPGDTSNPGGQGPGYLAPSISGEITQQVSAPKYTLRLEGRAVRIGYAIPTPRIASLGAITVKQVDQDVSQEQISALGLLPIYKAVWRLDYALPYATAETLPMPVNPAMW